MGSLCTAEPRSPTSIDLNTIHATQSSLVYVDANDSKDKNTLNKASSRLFTADGVPVGKGGKPVTVDIDSLPQSSEVLAVVQVGPDLNGTWLAVDGSARCSIAGGSTIRWPNGLTSELVYDTRTVWIVLRGKEIRAHVSGNKIIWNDGDEWIRKRS